MIGSHTNDAIVLDGLTRMYGSRRGALDISVRIPVGEVFGFLGPNGAGKTTVIRMLLGFIKPTAGTGRIFGHDIWTESPIARRSLAYLSGEPGYLGALTAAQTLEFLCRTRDLEPGAWQPLAERLELDTQVPIRKLSRGNRQKVGLVQVFMGQEPLLVMDEPSTGLDPLMQREFLRLLGEAKAAGRTIFLSSHNLPEVERACERVGIIREGRLVEVGPVRQLLGDHARAVTILFESVPPVDLFDGPGIQVVSTLDHEVHLLVRGDIRPLLERLSRVVLRDLTITTPDIEEVFMGYYEPSVQSDREDAPAFGGRT